MVSLRSIFYYKCDRSTQSLDREALDGQNSSILGIFIRLWRIRSFLILAHLLFKALFLGLELYHRSLVRRRRIEIGSSLLIIQP